MRIIGYAYEADVHCVVCTMRRSLRYMSATYSDEHDEHSLPLNAIDGEGNNVSPIFSTDEGASSEHCGDCFAPLI